MASTTHLEIDCVRSALDAMRQAEPLDLSHPLAHFLCLRGSGRVDTAIFDGLARLIQRKLNAQRALYELTPVTVNASLAEVQASITEDFQRHNEELEAWSYLYYRYIRYDLDFSVEDFQALTMQDRRTLQRRQSRAIVRLTHALARHEDRTRAHYRQAAQRSRLPLPYAPTLIGRESLITTALDRLAHGELPRHVLFYGAPGIGKSALALALAHHLIESLPLDNVAWIDQPEPGRVQEQIYCELDLPRLSDEVDLPSALTGYFAVRDALVVLDHAQALLDDDSALAQTLSVFGATRLILCARSPISQTADLPSILQAQVGELDLSSALDLLALAARDRDASRPDNEDRFIQLYRELGGNPRALRMALAMGSRYRPQRVDVYRSVWDNAADLARRVWLLLAMSPVGALSGDALCQIMPHVPPELVLDALDELRRASALSGGGSANTSTVALDALARTFAEGLLNTDDAALHELLYHTARCLADYLAVQPDFTGCIRLLQCAQQADLPPAFLLDLAYTFAPAVERAGAWSAWAHCLETLLVTVQGKDRLWVGLRLGIARRWLAEWQASAYALADVIELAGLAGDFALQAQAILELAAVHRQQKQFDTARAWLKRSADYYARMKLSQDAVTAELIQIALDKSDPTLAKQILDQSGDSSRAMTPRLLNLAAQIGLRYGSLETALYYALQAQQALSGDMPRLARNTALLGQIHHQLGNRQPAIDHLLGALSIMEQTHDVLGHARVRLNLAAIYLSYGNLRRALHYLRGLPDELASLGDLDSLQAAAHNLDLLNQLTRAARRPRARSA